MSIMWIKNQSKWVIFAAAILVAAGLILMDRPGAFRSGFHGDFVGSVGDEEISTAGFQQELKNYIRNEESRTGKAPEGTQLAKMREDLLQYKIQSILMQHEFDNYAMHASVEEMQDYMLQHPLEVGSSLARFEGPDRVPTFLRDSTLDTLRFRNWLAQDSIYDRVGMRVLEEQLRNTVVPQLQMQQLLKPQIHRTDLEEIFRLQMRESLAKIRFYMVSADSFPVLKEKFPENVLKAHFDANPDSFFHADAAARLKYIRLPILPSAHDTALMRDFGMELKQRAQSGETFSDLAKSYSNDPGSADSGGRLGGFQPRTAWVPEFAEAAFNLQPEGISDPVLTRFGYHIILLHSKKTEDKVEKAEVSHILLKITAGNETTDSLTDLAEKIKTEAEKTGLDSSALQHGLMVAKTQVFDKNTATPLGPNYLRGIRSFAFSPMEKKAQISDVLQNEEGLYIFGRDIQFSEGRDFKRDQEVISEALVLKEKVGLARKELESLRPQIISAGILPPPRIGKAILDSTALIPPETYVPGFGYGSPELLRVFQQKEGEWGTVLNTAQGAILAQIVNKQPLDTVETRQKVRKTISEGDTYIASNLYQLWISNLPKTAKVKNNLDMVFRN